MKMNHTIQLMEGDFTPSEANDIISALINEKINFHKLNRLSITEGNGDDECLFDSSRIGDLISSKKNLKDLIKKSKEDGKTFSITSTIEIKIK